MKKIKVIVKYPYRKPIETFVSTDGLVIKKYFIKTFDSFLVASGLSVLTRRCAAALGYPRNANICGVDFYGTIIFAGRDGDKLTDVPFDLNKFKILFPDLFLEE